MMVFSFPNVTGYETSYSASLDILRWYCSVLLHSMGLP
jgi:hypothetical protein